MKRDAAVLTARDLLNRLVCECGHVESEHDEHRRRCKPAQDDATCRCREFRPVRFRVERWS